MSDLIERLRDRASRFRGYVDGRGAASSELDEAADALEAANARIADLLTQLEQKELARKTLKDAADLTVETIGRQLDLIAERVPGFHMDKTPVIRSLMAHKKRLESAIERAAKENT